jgi:hypothetical protein
VYTPSMFGNSMRRIAPALLAFALLTTTTGCDLPEPERVGPSSTSAKAPKVTKETAKKPDKSGRGAPPPTPGKKPPVGASGTALAALDTLPVKGRAPMTGYERAEFGSEWSDAAGNFYYSRNGCDTRNDLLARDLTQSISEDNGCVIISGVLRYEPYTGATNVEFVAGGTYEQSFDAEHVVALGNAWATGAQQISPEKRAELANDPDNLFLADPSSNRSKGDADAATWLPSNTSFRCSYVARQIRVKARYDLWVTAAEGEAMRRILGTCPAEPLNQPNVQDPNAQTTQGAAPQPSTTPTPAPAKPVARPGNTKPKPSSAPVTYANCDEVRAAGAAPIKAGDSGYSAALDRDGDGSACE